jgi:serine/threonine protein kinase, bacterial
MWYLSLALLCAAFINGCSPSDSIKDGNADGVSSASPSVGPNSKEALQSVAHELDVLASQGKAAEAYQFYSQRCKNIIGDLNSFKAFLAVWLEGRDPRYSGVTVKINGSSAQVVSIDDDPNAPVDSMNPRTWTFIDGRWRFDNC